MGVLNITPDSFSDGGKHSSQTDESLARIVAEAEAMAAAGADIVDIGGESTRPGAVSVSVDQECERVLPVIRALRDRLQVTISIDTTKAEVARLAIAAGAEIVNDISGGRFDAEMTTTVDGLGACFVCGHVRGGSISEVHEGTPATFDEVVAELQATMEQLPPGLRERSIADPCIGFGKDLQTNLALVQRAGEMAETLGSPVLVGPSRKRFLGEITGLPVDERDAATVGACLASVSGGVHIVRVHAVSMTSAALQVFCAAQELAA
jgi:dihydropteroate synthase